MSSLDVNVVVGAQPRDERRSAPHHSWHLQNFRKISKAAIHFLRSGCDSDSRLRGSRRSNEHARFADKSRKHSQEESSDCVAHLLLHESNSWGRDSRARRGVGTLRLNRRGSLMVSGQVLADEAGHFEPKLKVSIGEESNHSNFSHQSSVKILSKFNAFWFLLENQKNSRFFNIFRKYLWNSDKFSSNSEQNSMKFFQKC